MVTVIEKVVQDVIHDLLVNVENDKLGWLSLSIGDQIRTPRWGGLYYHHGVYVGSNKVLHSLGDPWLGLSKPQCKIQIDTLQKFTKNLPGSVQIVCRGRQFENGDFTKHTGVMDYNILVNNCEHFASFVCTGESRSTQSNRFMFILIILISILFPKTAISTTIGIAILNNGAVFNQ